MKIEDYKEEMLVQGLVTGIKDYGVFVSFPHDVRGMIHISELSEKYVTDVNYFVTLNDYVTCIVLSVNKNNKNLKLSFKQLNKIVPKNKYNFKSNNIKIGFQTLKNKLEQEWTKE